MLMAVLAITAATGLMVGRRDRPRMAATPAGEIAAQVALSWKLDPNTATPEALAALPHIGPTLARRIAEARADGPFRSPDEIRARISRGSARRPSRRIEPYLRIEAVSGVGPRLDSPAIAIVDAAANPGRPAGSTSRKPPRPRTRKAKGASIQVAAKADASASP